MQNHMETAGYIELDPSQMYSMKIKDGYLDIRVSQDPEYPGLDVEYISEKERYDGTKPRVLIECPKYTDTLRCLVWGDPRSEDYSDSIDFDDTVDREME